MAKAAKEKEKFEKAHAKSLELAEKMKQKADSAAEEFEKKKQVSEKDGCTTLYAVSCDICICVSCAFSPLLLQLFLSSEAVQVVKTCISFLKVVC